MQKQISTITGTIIIIAAAVVAFGGVFLYLQKPQIPMTNVQSKITKSCLDTAATQYDMNICAGKLEEAADAKLNALYQKIAAQLDHNSLNQLIIAEQAWIKYRDENCRVPSIFPEAGSGAVADEAICMEQLTNDRIQALKNLYDGHVMTAPGTENINPNE